MVIPTECSNGKTGFETRMGKEKPMPKKLQISVKDIAKHRIQSLDFTPAKFNNFNLSNGEHTSIVTSTGKYLITWNFLKVKKGLLKSYQIKTMNKPANQGSHTLVDSQFEFNNDSKIIYTEPKGSVGVQTRSMKKRIEY